MRLLDRYLLRELLIPLGFCLCGFLIFWVAFDLFGNLGEYQNRHLHAWDVVVLYVVETPEFLVLVLPIALLLALLYTLTNLARYHEITAIRAAGVSLGRICLPYLLVGIFFSLGLFGLNEFWVPDTARMANQILLSRTSGAAADREEQPLFTLRNERDNRVWVIQSYNLRTDRMTGVQITWTPPDGSLWTLEAAHGAYRNNVWMFYGNVQEHCASNGPSSFAVLVADTNRLAKPDFTETPQDFKNENDFNQRFQRAVGQDGKPPEVPVSVILEYLRLHPHVNPSQRSWLFTELHGRLATPWTCLVVVLIAVPFAAASGRRNVFMGVASSIGIVFAFYVVQRLSLALGTGGFVPSWLAAWTPNLSFGAVGMWLMARVR